MKRKMMALVIGLISATGLQAQEIDGSSQEAFSESVAAMNESLEGPEAEQFGRGLVATMLDRYPPAKGAPEMARIMMLEQAMETAPTNLDGVTFAEIMAAGERTVTTSKEELQAEERAREERRAAEERAREEERRAAAERRYEEMRALEQADAQNDLQ